jgi:hypothetical protein
MNEHHSWIISKMSTPIYMTLSGLPLTVELQWPFRQSVGGADFLVLHGDVRLIDGSGLHAVVSVSLSQTMRDVMPSLEPMQAAPIVINALRKDVERKQLEFLKSDKRQPVPLSSRFIKFSTKQFVFEHADDKQLREMIERKVFWDAKLGNASSWILDPADLLYVGRSMEDFMKAALAVASDGTITLNGEYAIPTSKLLSRSDELEQTTRTALERLQQKHAFERA